MAVDENGGIYVVTSAAMYRFNWDGSALTLGWRAEYEVAEEVPSPIRLGPGSGSTPSLMGTNADDDRFVVITDGQALMNLVLFWRDEVPADWEPIAPGKDPRIACEIPVDFGTGATEAISEQSVAVRGSRRRHPRKGALRPGAHRLGSGNANLFDDLGQRRDQRAEWHPEHQRGFGVGVRDWPA
ncbi:MAG: hypothetical protein JRF54_15120 [Deltaproteobacteria bacterium]|nr:hypothetical protein [Deltaproteobacteria bacterium]